MSSLARFDTESGIELVINTDTGEAFASQAGYARMSGVSKQTISKRCLQGVNFQRVKMAEIETPGGLQGVNLIPAELVFEWLIKDNPSLAKEMGVVGATVYLHTLAGFKVSSDAVVVPTPTNPPLLSPDVRVSNLYQALAGFGIELDNPRYAQQLKDITLDILGVRATGTPSIEGTLVVPESWVGVAERAEQLGYPVALVTSKRSQLGKFVKGYGLEAKQEARLCNGTQRHVWLYKQCPQLDLAINRFFDPAV